MNGDYFNNMYASDDMICFKKCPPWIEYPTGHHNKFFHSDTRAVMSRKTQKLHKDNKATYTKPEKGIVSRDLSEELLAVTKSHKKNDQDISIQFFTWME